MTALAAGDACCSCRVSRKQKSFPASCFTSIDFIGPFRQKTNARSTGWGRQTGSGTFKILRGQLKAVAIS